MSKEKENEVWYCSCGVTNDVINNLCINCGTQQPEPTPNTEPIQKEDNQTSDVYRVIKSSERLPEEREYYFVKTIRNRKEVYNWHSEENSANTWENEVDCWLEKIPSTNTEKEYSKEDLFIAYYEGNRRIYSRSKIVIKDWFEKYFMPDFKNGNLKSQTPK